MIPLKPSSVKLLSILGFKTGVVTPGKNAKKTLKNAKISEANYSRNRVYGSGRAGSGQEQAKGITKFALSPLTRTKDFFSTLRSL